MLARQRFEDCKGLRAQVNEMLLAIFCSLRLILFQRWQPPKRLFEVDLDPAHPGYFFTPLASEQQQAVKWCPWPIERGSCLPERSQLFMIELALPFSERRGVPYGFKGRAVRTTPPPKRAFLGWPTNARLESFVFAEFYRKTGKATFANSA